MSSVKIQYENIDMKITLKCQTCGRNRFKNTNIINLLNKDVHTHKDFYTYRLEWLTCKTIGWMHENKCHQCEDPENDYLVDIYNVIYWKAYTYLKENCTEYNKTDISKMICFACNDGMLCRSYEKNIDKKIKY